MHDKLLKPYLEARSEREAERRLNELSETFLRPTAASVVRSILQRDQDDATQNALMAIVQRVQQIRHPTGHSAEPLRSLKGYAIIVARRAALQHKGAQMEAAKSVSLETLREEQGQEPEAEDADPFLRAASQESLRAIWREIKDLDPKRCGVLLLDWKDIPGGPVHLFVGAGVATLTEIATVLKMDASVLAGPLCWPDDAIAAHLKTTDKTVRSLRYKTCKELEKRLTEGKIGDVLVRRTSMKDRSEIHAK